MKSIRALGSLCLLRRSVRYFLLLFLSAFGTSSWALECGEATGQELRDPPTLHAQHQYLKSSLQAKVMDKCINGQVVSLKSYQDLNLAPDDRPVGPAYVFDISPKAPNPTFTLDFANQLGQCQGEKCECGHNGADVSICTNLHTHGLHISPAGNSDNVLLTFKPGDTFQYQFNIPNTHAPGTHWLHAHLHGSTAPQLFEGMSGALILKGETDYWLETQGIQSRTMILQQLSKDNGSTSLCGDTQTSINGQCRPNISAQSGEIMRLRLIHAGISASVYFGIADTNGNVTRLHEFARDGINLGTLQQTANVELQPGYRSDVLVQIPDCKTAPNCTLYVLDNESTASKSLYGEIEPEHVIATITVSTTKVAMTLPDTHNPHFRKPYPEIQDSELIPEIKKVYFASIPAGSPGNEDGSSTKHTVDGYVYPDGDPISLTVGQAQTWNVWVGDSQTSTPGPSHPYHIHVNPFEVIKRDSQGNIIERYWKDTYLISSSDNKGEANAVELRARYETFIGDFVMHCHNLSHEDAGMMKLVQMHLPTESSHSSH